MFITITSLFREVKLTDLIAIDRLKTLQGDPTFDCLNVSQK